MLKALATRSPLRWSRQQVKKTRLRWDALWREATCLRPLFLAEDPNWGRVLAAIGTVDVAGDVYAIDVSINGVRVCHAGGGDRPRSEVDLSPRATHVLIDLAAGRESATIWTNDLTHDYVHENSAYSS